MTDLVIVKTKIGGTEAIRPDIVVRVVGRYSDTSGETAKADLYLEKVANWQSGSDLIVHTMMPIDEAIEKFAGGNS